MLSHLILTQILWLCHSCDPDYTSKKTRVSNLLRVKHLVKGQSPDSSSRLVDTKASALTTLPYHFQKNWTSFLSIISSCCSLSLTSPLSSWNSPLQYQTRLCMQASGEYSVHVAQWRTLPGCHVARNLFKQLAAVISNSEYGACVHIW